ncbi:MAG: MFS transporter [Planctomycetes bacterium]|nr:MFS transporter [Planctomycetota bacterium]
MPARKPVVEIVSISLCRFAEALGIGMIVPVLPLFLQELSAPGFLAATTAEERTGILFGASGLAMALVQLAAGRIADRLDRRKALIIAGLAGAAAASALLLLLESFLQLLLVRVVQGVCLGITFPPMMAIVAYHSPKGAEGRVLGTYTTIRLLGFAGGPVAGGWLSALGGHQLTFATSALLLASSVAAVALWMPDYRVRAPGSAAPRLPFVAPRFYLLGAATFLLMVGISAVIARFSYYEKTFAATEWELGLTYGAFLFARCLSQYPMGWLGDRFDKKRVLLLALGLFVPAVFLQGIVESIAQLIGLRMILGVISAAITTTVGGICAERSPPAQRASVMGVNTFSFTLGTAVGPPLCGFSGGPESALPFVVPAGAAVLLALLIALFVPSDRGHREESKKQAYSPEDETGVAA